MTGLVITVVVLLMLVMVAAIVAKKVGGANRKERGKIWRRRLLSKNEQPMYFRLCETFPNHVVLTQVAFSALIDGRSRATRNTFDRKVADFVLCTKAFEVIAVIELDDSSHKKREVADAARDELLTSAGYQVLRFPRVPDVAELGAAVLIPSKVDVAARAAPRGRLEPSSLMGEIKEK